MDIEIQYQKLRQTYRQLIAVNPKSKGFLELIEKIEQETKRLLNRLLDEQIRYARTNH